MLEKSEGGNSGSLPSDINDGMTMKQCEDMIQRSLENPTVRFLIEHLKKAGCYVGNNFIKATPCDNTMGGRFVPGKGVIICSNHIEIQDDVDQVLIHELIHAYDDCRAANLDWRNCAHHACSEIRAGRLSGDCDYKRELLRGFTATQGQENECIKRRVMKSLKSNRCTGMAARFAMEDVWDICYNDMEPFDRAP